MTTRPAQNTTKNTDHILPNELLLIIRLVSSFEAHTDIRDKDSRLAKSADRTDATKYPSPKVTVPEETAA